MRAIKLAAALVSVIAASPCFSQAPAEKNAAEANQDWHVAGTIEGFDSHIYSLAFGPGSILVVGDGGYAHVWDVATKQEQPFYKRPPGSMRAIIGIRYASDNTWVSFRELNAYHLAFGDNYLAKGIPTDYGVGVGIPRPLAIAFDGMTYATHSVFGKKNVVEVIRDDIISRVTQKKPMNPIRVAECKGHQGEPTCAAFSPDGKLLATGSDDKTIRLWNASTGKELAVLAGHTDAIVAVEYSPDGKLIATGSKDGVIKLWDAATNNERASVGGKTAVRCLAFAADGKSIATGYDDGTLRICSVDDPQRETLLADHTGSVFAVAFSRDGKLLASGGQDKVLRLWKK